MYDHPADKSFISIHALREEGDGKPLLGGDAGDVISIHALREEGDPRPGYLRQLSAYFYPRPPRGGRRWLPPCVRRRQDISIHALREEGDCSKLSLSTMSRIFLSTPSARRATCVCGFGNAPPFNFYPRPPRGGRHNVRNVNTDGSLFLSTPSARRATAGRMPLSTWARYFYPRPPRGGRRWKNGSGISGMHFYPRPPRGGRPPVPGSDHPDDISIHALREEGDQTMELKQTVKKDFYPRPPRGGRPSPGSSSTSLPSNFYPRPPRGGRPRKGIRFCGLILFLSTPSARRATAKTEKNISAFVSL